MDQPTTTRLKTSSTAQTVELPGRGCSVMPVAPQLVALVRDEVAPDQILMRSRPLVALATRGTADASDGE